MRKQSIREQYYQIFKCKQDPKIPKKIMQISVINEQRRITLLQSTVKTQNHGPWKKMNQTQQKVQPQYPKKQFQERKPQQPQTSKSQLIKQQGSIKKVINHINNESSNRKVITIVGKQFRAFKQFKRIIQTENKQQSFQRANPQASFTLRRLNYLKVMNSQIKSKNPPPKPMILIDLAASDITVKNGKMKVRYTVIGNESDPQIYKNINILNYTDQNWKKAITQTQHVLPEIVIDKIQEKQSKNISNTEKKQQKVIPTLNNPSNQLINNNKLSRPPILQQNLNLNPFQNTNQSNPFTQKTINSNLTLNKIMQSSSTTRQISSVKPQTNFQFHNPQIPSNNSNTNHPFNNNTIKQTNSLFSQNVNFQPSNPAPHAVPMNIFNPNSNIAQINAFLVTKKQESQTGGGLFGPPAPQKERATFKNIKKKVHNMAFN